MRFMNVARAVLVGSMVALSAGVASAAHLTIIDTASDVTVQPDNNFELGFGSVQNNQHDWSFSGGWIATTGSSGQGIIYFVDPNTNELEDIYTLSWTWDNGIARLEGRFESADNGVIVSGRTIPAGFPTVPATDANVDVLGLFRLGLAQRSQESSVLFIQHHASLISSRTMKQSYGAAHNELRLIVGTYSPEFF